ncbi:MAG TPA: SRPBCC family protein [Hymenobacter sp.]|uniref:SRPBCC family protein n=1 Tax=Hymenobacter sp. TaxID=1898978 RepID=UPI002D802EF4|nr:SRPBCC family protein [Hymenobacter sp.]HET9506044.1 SRPBCC family protein [Hymenobacter sp.]
MPVIEIITSIGAPLARCFYLALSVDLHTESTRQTQERIVGGVRNGLLQPGDEVTFRARHFGVWQTLTSKITAYQAPTYFCDEMQRGTFKAMRHEHYFEPAGANTIMRDVFEFASPLGLLGKVADTLVLSAYLRRFLEQRAAVLKRYAETDAWQAVLPAGNA